MNKKNFFKVEFSDDDEYENFRKNIDFSKIIELGFRNSLNNESIFVKDRNYRNRDFYSYSFSGSSPNGRFDSCNLSITIENGREFGILCDGNFLRKESLRKLGIFEKNGLRSVVKKIAMDLLTGNPMLKYENIPTNTRKPLYIHIMNHLFELGLLNPKERCGCKEFNLFFPQNF
uniref:HATPase_c_4 domain-containing protein n=1 Tax=Strongyloides papillosus TaxID=174720 RepID=A0A0N5BJS4_STREA